MNKEMAQKTGLLSNNKGFTLIELVMVIVILGILAAVAIPKYVDLKGDATDAAKAGMRGAIHSAFSIAIAEHKGFPTLTQLDNAMAGNDTKIAAGNTGISFTIDGIEYTVLTYKQDDCTGATSLANDSVHCVGNFAP